MMGTETATGGPPLERRRESAERRQGAAEPRPETGANGTAMAAFLAAAIGAFSVGLIVILGEAGLTAPMLYRPALGLIATFPPVWGIFG